MDVDSSSNPGSNSSDPNDQSKTLPLGGTSIDSDSKADFKSQTYESKTFDSK